MGERKPQAVNAMRSYLMHSRFWMGNSKNNINGATRWLSYRTLAMRVRGGIILRCDFSSLPIKLLSMMKVRHIKCIWA
jgi:hypothetical protein